jgi:hypothetical protein
MKRGNDSLSRKEIQFRDNQVRYHYCCENISQKFQLSLIALFKAID